MTKGKILLLFFSLILSFIQFHCCTMIALQLSSKKSLTSKSSPEKWEELKSGKEIHVFFPHDTIITGKFIRLENDTLNSMQTFSDQDSQRIFSSVRSLLQLRRTDQAFNKDILSGQETSLYYTGITLKPEFMQDTFIRQDIKLYIPIKKIEQVKYHSLKWGWLAIGIAADAVIVYSTISLLERMHWDLGLPHIGWPRDWNPF
jgi:hypothetical protein